MAKNSKKQKTSVKEETGLKEKTGAKEKAGIKEKAGAKERNRTVPDPRVLAAVCLVLAIFRIWLAAHTNYGAVMSPYDDEMQMRQGLSLYRGAWLGEYNLVTLIKGIIYPAFLALCMHLQLTYGVMLGILTVIAAAVFAGMVAVLTPDRRAAAAAFVLAAFHPVGYAEWSAMRIYRDVLAAPFLLILASCLAAVFFLRKEPLRKSIPWFAGLIVIYPLFKHLREDSVWVLPLVITALALTLAGRFPGKEHTPVQNVAEGKSRIAGSQPSRKAFLLTAVLCVMPFLASQGLGSYISDVNMEHYGIRTENDRVKGNFAEMMKLIGSVEDPGVNDYVWITRDMLFQCVEASPTLKQMEEGIRFRYEESAEHQLTPEGEKVTEVMGDYTQWILRNTFYDYGLYRDARETDQVLAGIVRELQEAYADGRLKKDSRIHLSSQGRGMKAGELAAYAGKTAAGMARLAIGEGMKSFYPFVSRVSGETRDTYELVLGIDLGESTVNSGAYRFTDGIYRFLTLLYRVGMAVMHAAAAVLFFRGVSHCVKDRERVPELLPSLVCGAGMVLSAAVLVYMVSAFTSFLSKQYFYNYSTGFYPLILTADVILLLTYKGERKWDT